MTPSSILAPHAPLRFAGRAAALLLLIGTLLCSGPPLLPAHAQGLPNWDRRNIQQRGLDRLLESNSHAQEEWWKDFANEYSINALKEMIGREAKLGDPHRWYKRAAEKLDGAISHLELLYHSYQAGKSLSQGDVMETVQELGEAGSSLVDLLPVASKGQKLALKLGEYAIDLTARSIELANLRNEQARLEQAKAKVDDNMLTHPLPFQLDTKRNEAFLARMRKEMQQNQARLKEAQERAQYKQGVTLDDVINNVTQGTKPVKPGTEIAPGVNIVEPLGRNVPSGVLPNGMPYQVHEDGHLCTPGRTVVQLVSFLNNSLHVGNELDQHLRMANLKLQYLNENSAYGRQAAQVIGLYQVYALGRDADTALAKGDKMSALIRVWLALKMIFDSNKLPASQSLASNLYAYQAIGRERVQLAENLARAQQAGRAVSPGASSLIRSLPQMRQAQQAQSQSFDRWLTRNHLSKSAVVEGAMKTALAASPRAASHVMRGAMLEDSRTATRAIHNVPGVKPTSVQTLQTQSAALTRLQTSCAGLNRFSNALAPARREPTRGVPAWTLASTHAGVGAPASQSSPPREGAPAAANAPGTKASTGNDIAHTVNRIRNGAHGALPQATATAVGRGERGAGTMTVLNFTGYTLEINFSGPSQTQLRVPVGGQGVAHLKEGVYEVTAHIPGESRIRPFYSGNNHYQTNQRYTLPLYVNRL